MGVRAHDQRAGTERNLPNEGPELRREVPDRPVREYLSAQQLSDVTPWSTSAIEKMVARGILIRDIHYFQPFGRRSQLIFKHSSIVDLIEGRSNDSTTSLARNPLPSRVGVEAAEAGLRGLLRR